MSGALASKRAEMKLSPRQWLILLVVIFLVAFLVRAWEPTGRPAHWFIRANRFWRGLEELNWAETYQRHHPGTTIMFLGGIGSRMLASFPATRSVFDLLTPWFVTERGRRIAAGVIFLSLVNGVLIAWIADLLRKLGDWRLGIAAGGFLAFSPFYLAHSRAYHLDGQVTTFMLLSAVLLLWGMQSGKRRFLVVSGFVGGLALLTKTPALFLVPYTGLVLLVYAVSDLYPRWSDGSADRARWVIGEAWQRIAFPLLLWSAMAILPFALWPAMFVQPIDILRDMYENIAHHVETTHPQPRFFAGRYFVKSVPPLLFYPVTYAFNITFMTFVMSAIGIGAYTLWRRRGKLALSKINFWLIVAYIFFFTLQMVIGNKQSQRYSLPGYGGILLIAAVGLVWFVDRIVIAFQERAGTDRNWLAPALIGLGIGLHALAALPYMPDYGAHHNHLLGGNIGASYVIELGDQREGTYHLGRYLNEIGNEPLVIGKIRGNTSALDQYYDGKAVAINDREANVYVLEVNEVQRRINQDRWEGLEGKRDLLNLVFNVQYDGIDYVELYAPSQADLPVETVSRGGVWLIVVAWVVTIAVGGLLFWSLRSVNQETHAS